MRPSILPLASLVLSTLCLPACLGGGGDWVYQAGSPHRFYDGSKYPGDGWSNRDIDEFPIAAGSAMIVILADVESTSYDSFEVIVADESVLGVEVDGDERARLAALSEGITLATMDVAGSSEDPTFYMEVAEVAAVRWVLDDDLTSGTVVAPQGITTESYAMRPGAVIQVGAQAQDADGRDLSGQGLYSWTWQEGMLQVEEDLETINSVQIEALGTGTTLLSAGLGENLELALLAQDEATQLRLYEPDPDNIQLLDAIEAEAGPALFGLAAFDQDDRLVLPAPDDGLDITVLEGPEDLVQSWEFEVEFNGFAVSLCPGEGEIELSYAGGSQVVPVTAEEGEDTPDSCGG